MIDKAAAKPAVTRTDSYIKSAKVAGLEGFRRYQFSRPQNWNCTAALTVDALYTAVRASRGGALLPFATPFLLGSLALYALVGTGEKTSWEEPGMHPLLFAAAAVSRFGVLGLGEIAAVKSGHALKTNGFSALAKAAYAVATGVSYGIEPLRAALACISFVLQLPFALVGALIHVGVASVAVARQGGFKAPEANGKAEFDAKPAQDAA